MCACNECYIKRQKLEERFDEPVYGPKGIFRTQFFNDLFELSFALLHIKLQNLLTLHTKKLKVSINNMLNEFIENILQ